MDSIVEALVHTPWWVYLILAYCLFVGFKGIQGGVVPFGKMAAMPIIFTVMSIETLQKNFAIDIFVIATYAIAMIIGILLGMLFARMVGLEVDSKKWLLKFPGSWSTMVLILLIFSTKYYFGYELDVDPKLLENTHFEFFMLSTSSIITGVFIGRMVYYLMKLLKGPSVELSED